MFVRALNRFLRGVCQKKSLAGVNVEKVLRIAFLKNGLCGRFLCAYNLSDWRVYFDVSIKATWDTSQIHFKLRGNMQLMFYQV